MEQAKEAASLLRARGMGPLLDTAHAKIYRESGVRGRIQLAVSPANLAALADLMGWKQMPGGARTDQVAIRLAELDARLRASRFGTGLLDVLEADRGPLRTRVHERDQARSAWTLQLQRIADAAPAEASVQAWISGLDSDGPGARRYRRAYGEDAAAAAAAALAVARALAALPANGQLLAVFAAEITGDPHAFDAPRLAGRLLLAALEERPSGSLEGLSAVQAREFLLSQVGLAVDGVSSTVLIANLPGSHHPVLAAMSEHGGGWPLPLQALQGLQFDGCTGRPLYVVENPPVFAYLQRAAQPLPPLERPALVCTAGFPSAAGIRLLDALAKGGFVLNYGGDFDVNGLTIAEGLQRRYPALKPWRMAPEDYLAARDPSLDSSFDDAGKRWLCRYTGVLVATATVMAATGMPAYQERLVETLLKDCL